MSDRSTPPPPPFPPPQPERPPGPPPQSQPGYPQPPAPYPGQTAPQGHPGYAPDPQANPYPSPPPGPNAYPGTYPNQCAPGYGPPPPQGGGGGRRKVIAMVAAGVALALVAGLGAWFALAGDDEDKASATGGGSTAGPGGQQTTGSGGTPPKESEAKVDLTRLWALPAATSDTSLRGGWAGGDKVYVLREKDITVHDLATGAESAKVAMPAGFEEICSVKDTPVEGVGLFAWESPDGGCANVTAVDLAKNTVLWTAKDLSEGLSFEVAIGAYGDLAVLGADDTAVAVDLRTGGERWRWRASSATPPKGGSGWDISDLAVSADQVALTLQSSASGAVKYIGGVAVLDPAKGTTRGSTQLANGNDSWPTLLSAAPLVVLDEYDDPNADEGASNLAKALVLDGTAKPTAEIPVGKDGLVLDERGFDFIDPNENLGGVLVHGNVLYTQMGTDEDEGKVGAFDLTTGKLIWSASVGMEGYVRMLEADEKGFTLLVGGSKYDGGEGKVIRFAAADGKPTTVHVLRAGPGAGSGAGSGSGATGTGPTRATDPKEGVVVDPEGLAVVLPDNRVLQFSTSDATRPVEMYGAS
ncbi:hypothetical protein [Streptodolium elevatio]